MQRFAPAIVAAAVLLCTLPLWTSCDLVYSRHSDIIQEHLSIKELQDEEPFPLWNPYTNAGTPAMANPQAMYAFPFDLLYLVLPVAIATNLVIVLNFLLAGLAAYALARLHLRSRASAVFAALCYAVAFRYLAMIHCGWLPKMSMYALAPLVFWSAERAMRRPSGGRAAVFALVVAAVGLQGDLQQAYFVAIAGIAYMLVRARDVEVRSAWLALTAGAVTGLALVAPFLLQRLELAGLSTRQFASYEFFLHNAPHPSDLWTIFDPRTHGLTRDEFWEKSFFFGLWFLPAIAVALAFARRRAAWLLVAIAAAFALCFDSSLLRALYDYAPGFDLFRQSSRVLLTAQLAAAMVAGLAFDGVLLRLEQSSRWRRHVPIVVVALCLVPVSEGLLRVTRHLETRPIAAALPDGGFRNELGGGLERGRTLAIGLGALSYGTAGHYHIHLVNGVASLNLRHYLEYWDVLQRGDPSRARREPRTWTDLEGIARPSLLAGLDVRTIVTNMDADLSSLGFERTATYRNVPSFVLYRGVIEIPEIHVWRVRRALGPAYFARSVTAVASDAESLARVAVAPSPRDAVVFADQVSAPITVGEGGAELVAGRLDDYSYEVTSARGGFLILSQVWYPGWRAAIDGVSVPLLRTNHALIGCAVPPGDHTLRLSMTAPALRAGLPIAALGGGALLLLIGIDLVRRRRARAVADPEARAAGVGEGDPAAQPRR